MIAFYAVATVGTLICLFGIASSLHRLAAHHERFPAPEPPPAFGTLTVGDVLKLNLNPTDGDTAVQQWFRVTDLDPKTRTAHFMIVDDPEAEDPQ